MLLKRISSHIWRNVMLMTSLFVILMMMGCASGMPKTQESLKAWKFDESIIKETEEKCTGKFKPATAGTIDGLWENKRSILRDARECARVANILAEQAKNRNKVIGE